MGNFYWFFYVNCTLPTIFSVKEEILANKQDFPGKIRNFKKTWIPKFPFNLQLWQYEKKNECLHSLQKAKIQNPDCQKSRLSKIRILEIFWLEKYISEKKYVLHAKNQTTATINDSFMTKNKLIIEAMKIGGCRGHVALIEWKPCDKTQMVD